MQCCEILKRDCFRSSSASIIIGHCCRRSFWHQFGESSHSAGCSDSTLITTCKPCRNIILARSEEKRLGSMLFPAYKLQKTLRTKVREEYLPRRYYMQRVAISRYHERVSHIATAAPAHSFIFIAGRFHTLLQTLLSCTQTSH